MTGNFAVQETSTISDYIASSISWFIALVFLAAFGYVALRVFLRVTHYNNSLKMVTLSVTLPKKQSQLDKQNEVNNSMKEVVAVMEQLLTSLMSHNGDGYQIVKPVMAVEYIVQGDTIRFCVSCLASQQHKVESVITSYYADAVVEPVDDYNIFSAEGKQAACVARLSSKDFKPLNTYQTLGVDPINAITNALTKFEEGEGAAVSFVLRPLSNTWGNKGKRYAKEIINKARNPKEGQTPVHLTAAEEEQLKHIEEKAAKVGFGVTLRIVTNAKEQQKANQLMEHIQSAFGQYDRPGLNKLVFSKGIKGSVLKDFIFKYPGSGQKEMKLNSEELASLFHFPNAQYNEAPNIVWQKFKFLAPPSNLPKPDEGELYLGENRFRGVSTPVYLKPKDRFRHFYVIGQTGTGKSTILFSMAAQDIKAGRGVCLMDPHGDLSDALLGVVPKDRVDDVIYFNPGDTSRPMGLNLLEADTTEERERVALDATAMMIKLFGEEVFSARLQEYFQNAVLTLMEDKEDPGTLIDVVRMFTDEAYQKQKVSKCTNSTVLKWWNTTYANMGDREKQEIIPYFSSKFNQFSTNMMMRNIVGQQKSAFDIKEVMDGKKILLINLAKGKLGDLNASLIGMILVSKIQAAAMARTNQPEEERVPFYMYLDEFQNVVTDKIESILSEARKYKLSLTIAHQFLAQLDKVEEVKKAVFGNIGSMMCYKIGAEDSEYMAKEFAPLVSDQDLVNIAVFTGVAKVSVDTQPSAPFTLHPVKPAETYKQSDPKMVKALQQLSRLKYGRDVKFVGREIDQRMKG